MNFIDRIKSVLYPSRTVGDPISAWQGIYTPRRNEVDYSGVDALLSSAVMACVNSITRAFPEAPLRVMKRNGEGISEEVPDHALAALIARPNPDMTSDEFWQATLLDYSIDGNAYWHKVRSGGGRGAPVELWPLPSVLVRARWPSDGSEFIGWYEVLVDGRWERLERADVVHFRNGIDWADGRAGRYGLSPIKSVMREIFTDTEAERWVASLLRNGAFPGIIISPKDDSVSINPTDAQALAADFERRYTGDRRGRPMVALNAMKLEKFGFSPTEMDFTKLRRIAEERVSALLNVPAIVAGLGAGLDRSTYSNYEQALAQFWTCGLLPLQRAFATKLNGSLLPDFGTAAGLTVAFDTSQVGALQEDRTEAETRALKGYEVGAFTLNETRARCGQDPDPQGDRYKDGTGFGEEYAPPAALPPTEEFPALRAARAPFALLKAAEPDELERAEEFWEAHAERRFRRLLAAGAKESA